MRRAVNAGPLDFLSLTAGLVKDKDIWATLNGYPSAPEANKLTIIRSAEKITNWQPFEDWLADSRRMPTCYVVVVSNERDFPYIRDKDKKSAVMPSYIDKGRLKIHLVRCIAPWGGDAKNGNEGKDLIAWAQRHVRIAPKDVLALMQHCGGSLTKAKAVLDKASLFPGQLSFDSIKMLIDEQPSEDFTNSLLAMDKPKALLALESLHPDDYSRVIGLLDTTLTTMGKIFIGLSRSMTISEMAHDLRIGVPHFLVRKYFHAAKHYDLDRQRACRATLALHDVHIRAGQRVGVLESLVAQW